MSVTPPPQIYTATDSIQSAHKQDMVLAHMFEFNISDEKRLQTMCDVMAGKEGALHFGYDSMLNNVFEATPLGIRGLATTALSASQPGNLWTNVSSIGLIFDGRDRENIKLEHFHPYDAQSGTSAGMVHYLADLRPSHLGSTMFDILKRQYSHPEKMETPRSGLKILDVSSNDSGRRSKRTESAMKAFCKALKKGELPDYERDSRKNSPEKHPFINETTISAKLQGIKGIVVSNMPHCPATAESITKAENLAKWLTEHYPNEIPTPPPVMLYDGKNLTPHQQETEIKPKSSSSRINIASPVGGSRTR